MLKRHQVHKRAGSDIQLTHEHMSRWSSRASVIWGCQASHSKAARNSIRLGHMGTSTRGQHLPAKDDLEAGDTRPGGGGSRPIRQAPAGGGEGEKSMRWQ